MHQHTARPLTEEEIECLRGCSSFKQYFTMRKRFESGGCAFCQIDRELNKVLYGDNEDSTWIGWEVPQGFSSYKPILDLQFVYLPKRHVRHLNELNEREREEFWKITDWIYDRYEIPGGGFIARVGDMRYNVGTVPHLHFNTFVPNRTDAVTIFLQKSEKTWKEHDERMAGFAVQYDAGKVPE